MTDSASARQRLVSRLKTANTPAVNQFAPYLQAGTDPSVPDTTPTVPSPPVPQAIDESESDSELKLRTFEEVVREVQSSIPVEVAVTDAPVEPEEHASVEQDPPVEFPPVLSQVAPSMITAATDTLNPVYATRSAKEAVEPGGGLLPSQEVGGLQPVEQEARPEISPEISEYIQEVQAQIAQQPQEIVLTSQGDANLQPVHQPQPVVVLPITPEVETLGARKPPSSSIRWLVEFSRKLMKMFSGHIIYRQT